MTTQQLIAPLPQITLERFYTVQFEAIDPDTGLEATGVTVGNVSLTTLQAASFDQTTPVAVTPIWIPLALEAQS